jgi:hypothetical protein
MKQVIWDELFHPSQENPFPEVDITLKGGENISNVVVTAQSAPFISKSANPTSLEPSITLRFKDSSERIVYRHEFESDRVLEVKRWDNLLRSETNQRKKQHGR